MFLGVHQINLEDMYSQVVSIFRWRPVNHLLILILRTIYTFGRALDDNNMTGTLDIDRMLAVPNRSRSLTLVTLTNNKIRNVAYSGLIVNLPIKFK